MGWARLDPRTAIKVEKEFKHLLAIDLTFPRIHEAEHLEVCLHTRLGFGGTRGGRESGLGREARKVLGHFNDKPQQSQFPSKVRCRASEPPRESTICLPLRRDVK